jgi:hypothetical protein
MGLGTGLEQVVEVGRLLETDGVGAGEGGGNQKGAEREEQGETGSKVVCYHRSGV